MNKTNELKSLITKHKKIVIQPHDFPDPDGIASAYGLSELIKQLGFNSSIIYTGKLERTIMLAMIKYMNIDINYVDKQVLNESDKILVVDCNPKNSNVMSLGGSIIGIIDHHEILEKTNNTEYEFIDIRSDIGATSTIIANYYFDLGIKPSKNVATALAIGIYIDTSHLTRKTTRCDIETYGKLIDLLDKDILRFILINNLELKDIDFIKTALNNYYKYKNFMFVNIGNNSDSNFIGIMSDFFLSIKEIDFSVIFSKTDKGIVLSVRNLNPKWNAAKIIKKALEGLGSGGGHKQMAGGFIDNENLPSSFSEALLCKKFTKILFDE